LSDSHGKLKMAEQVVSELGELDLVLHAGDYYEDGLQLAEICGVEVKAVTGNCDRCATGPAEELLELGGYRIYLTHGHLFGVKRSLARLYQRALEVGAAIVIYGHTHIPHQEQIGNILFLNPGSITWPRSFEHTFAVLELQPDGFTAEICEF
jgi:putative phosphoesterase